MNRSRSRWRGWKTAARTAAGRAVPVHGEDQEPLPADPAMARTRSWQPPTRLPTQESDFLRFGNLTPLPMLHFGLTVLRTGLTPPIQQRCTALRLHHSDHDTDD